MTTPHLTEAEWKLVILALNGQSFREATINLDLGLKNNLPQTIASLSRRISRDVFDQVQLSDLNNPKP